MTNKEKMIYLEKEHYGDLIALEYLKKFISEQDTDTKELYNCVLKLNYINNCYEQGIGNIIFNQDIYFNNKALLLNKLGIDIFKERKRDKRTWKQLKC